MKKEWVLKKQEENAGKADELFEAFKNEMNQSGLFTDSEIHDVCTRMNEWDKMFPIYFLTVLLSCIEQRSKSMDKDQFGTWFDSAFKFSRDIEDIVPSSILLCSVLLESSIHIRVYVQLFWTGFR